MKFLYFSPLPTTAQPQEATTTGKHLSALEAVDLSTTSIEATGSQAADVRLEGQYRYGAKFATKFASELDELADSAFTELPLFGSAGGEEVSRPGYYAIESATIEPLHPNSHDVWTYDLSLTLEGTQATHRQRVATSTSNNSIKNDWGNDRRRHVAIPAGADVVEWWDGSAETEPATSIETRESAFGDLAIYDADAAPFDDPALVYRSPGLEAERDLHCRVWDDHGRSDKRDGDGVVHWVRAFATDHDPRGALVLSNGLLRVTLDDRGGELTAEWWTGYGGGEYGGGGYGESQWTPIDLPASPWHPLDVDVRTISPARIEARVLFSDGSQRYPLDMILARGADAVLFARVQNPPGETPQTLVDYLDPIASTTIYDTGAAQSLVPRKEVSQ